MVHRRFSSHKDETPSYSRIPHPNAKNYFDEMAPGNGKLPVTQEAMEALQREKDAIRDEISKRMGEMLLRGVTMLDAYCEECNGILMEDRAGVRSCVTCQVYDEKGREGKRNIEVDLESELHEEEEPHVAPQNVPNTAAASSSFGAVTIQEIPRGSWQDPSELDRILKNSVVKTYEPPAAKVPKTTIRFVPSAEEAPSFRSTPMGAKIVKTKPNGILKKSTSGYDAAIKAIDKKLHWAAEQVEISQDVDHLRQLVCFIKEASELLRS